MGVWVCVCVWGGGVCLCVCVCEGMCEYMSVCSDKFCVCACGWVGWWMRGWVGWLVCVSVNRCVDVYVCVCVC